MRARFDGRNTDVRADIFERGMCLPSDNKMTEERIIEVIQFCFSCKWLSSSVQEHRRRVPADNQETVDD